MRVIDKYIFNESKLGYECGEFLGGPSNERGIRVGVGGGSHTKKRISQGFIICCTYMKLLLL